MNDSTAAAALDAVDALFFVLEDGRIAEWNTATDEATAEQSLADRPFAALFDDSDAVEHAIERAAASGDATVEAEFPGAGCAYEFELERLDDGRIAVLGHDISERQAQRRELEKRERVLKRTHEVIADGDRSFDEQIRALLGLAREELGLAAGSLSRVRGEETDFEIVDGGGPIRERESIPVDETFCDVVVADRETLVINDARSDDRVVDRDTHADRGVACYLGAPVYLGDEVYGSLCFYDTEARSVEFSPWDVTLVDLLAQWVSYELRRRRDTERLRQQNEKLDRFASIVSHDLRNPLNVVSGSLELAKETGDAEHFDRAESGVARMETLIDDMLALARAGDAIDDTEPVELASVARESWSGVDTGTATLTIATESTILADRDRLRQLLENLFRNAIEHSSTDSRQGENGGSADETPTPTTDGGSLTVTVGDVTEDGHVVGFYVADDGVGIDADSREDVFESGFTTSEDGTGFGLAIVGEITDAHGWDVSLVEGEDGGARFEFTGVELVENEN
ncbi:sensor histidine kinase [Halolamina salina]|uniref:histidine kinase n=1 Tax=Halolamina salina TaxID=1220023 RepID=A0ABD6B3J1_9EURY